MSSHERDLARVTFFGVVAITALAFAPTVILYAVIGAGLLAVAVKTVAVVLGTRRTLEQTDRELAEQRTIRRLRRQQQRMHGGGGFRG